MVTASSAPDVCRQGIGCQEVVFCTNALPYEVSLGGETRKGQSVANTKNERGSIF